MKLVMAVSKDGYISRSHTDDMKWLGPWDKQVFRLLTNVGNGQLGTSVKTAAAMPPSLKGRRIHALSTRPRVDGVKYDLAWFENMYRDAAWCIGGMSLAAEAIRSGFVTQAFICKSDRYAFPDLSSDVGAVHVGPLDMLLALKFVEVDEFKVGDTTVTVYNRF